MIQNDSQNASKALQKSAPGRRHPGVLGLGLGGAWLLESCCCVSVVVLWGSVLQVSCFRGVTGTYFAPEELVRVLNINGFVPVKGGQPLGSPNTQIDPTA